jgi:hypothetical protein
MQAVVCCDLPHLPHLEKPSGGVRPIAVIGNMASAGSAVCPGSMPQRWPQPGAATGRRWIPGGRQIVGHAIHAGMSGYPCCVTLQVDWQIAFHTLCRDHMLVAVELRCPALLPIVAWAYRIHRNLVVHQTPGTPVAPGCGVEMHVFYISLDCRGCRHSSYYADVDPGLYNLGYTCFMNGALQCLCHCMPLMQASFQRNTETVSMNTRLRKGGEHMRLAPLLCTSGEAAHLHDLFSHISTDPLLTAR